MRQRHFRRSDQCRQHTHGLAAVVNGARIAAAQAAVNNCLDDGRVQLRALQGVHEVDNRGGAAPEVLQAAHQRQQVGFAWRHRLGGRKGNGLHPLLHGHVFTQALDGRLEEVGVNVEQPRKKRTTGCLQHRPPGVFSVDSFDGVQRQDYAILDCEGAALDHGTLFVLGDDQGIPHDEIDLLHGQAPVG